MHLHNEIAQQPTVIKRLLDEGRDDADTVAAAIRGRNPAFACIAARGTSDHAALYAQYLFGYQAAACRVMLADPVSTHGLPRRRLICQRRWSSVSRSRARRKMCAPFSPMGGARAR